jgi:chromosome segregation ATPase
MAKSNQAMTEDEQHWYLRTSGDCVFGPTYKEGLIGWAERGQVLAEHEVSTDRKTWVAAATIDFLDIKWFIKDGTEDPFGPFNRAVAEMLIQSGKVSPSARILLSSELDEPAESEASGAENQRLLRKQYAELQRQFAEQEEQIVLLKKDASLAMAQAITKATADLKKQLAERDELVKQMRTQASDALNAVVQERDAAKRALAESEQQIHELSERVTFLDQQLKQGDLGQQRQIEQLLGRVQSLESTLSDTQCVYEKQVALISSKEREFAVVRDALAEEKANVAELKQTLAQREQELREWTVRFADLERSFTELREEANGLQGQVEQAHAHEQELESELADVLEESNSNAVAHSEKIAQLEKLCSQSPEEVEHFYEERTALYLLMREEVDELTATLERERANLEQFKDFETKRLAILMDRKQNLLRQLGESPVDMTKRVVREQASDQNVARMRMEYEALRMRHERELRMVEERERDLQRKLKNYELDAVRQQNQRTDSERLERQFTDVSEQLQRREQELSEERRRYLTEREQFQQTQTLLLSRIDALEKESRTAPASENQPPSILSDSRDIKLPHWMRFKN